MRFIKGFWEIQNQHRCFHVTPNLKAIQAYGGIASRAYRGVSSQTLGGEHDISISSYNNIWMAKNTLLFLYRVWQRVHGLLSDDILRRRFRVLDIPSATNAQELLSKLTEQFNSIYPIVGGDEWAKDIEVEDLVIIEFLNPSRLMFVNRLFGKAVEYLSAVTQTNIAQLSRISTSESYLRGDEWLDSEFYGAMRSSLRGGALFFNPARYHLSIFSKQDNRVWCDKIFGDNHRVKISKDGVYKLGGVSFDFSPVDILYESICEYDISEDEIRVFRPIFSDEFLKIYTIHDVLVEATMLNGGEEPLLLDKKYRHKN